MFKHRILHQASSEYSKVFPNILTCSQLSFSDPAAYDEIYNSNNRWDKEPTLYQSFGQDHTTFGYLKYSHSKKQNDTLSPMFSRMAISDHQALIQKNVSLP